MMAVGMEEKGESGETAESATVNGLCGRGSVHKKRTMCFWVELNMVLIVYLRSSEVVVH